LAQSQPLLRRYLLTQVRSIKTAIFDRSQYNEPVILAFNPKMSYVEKEFAAADPGFWNPKPKAAARPSGQ
jgi:hypothetical protein